MSKDLASQIKFRSMLSKTTRDGVTAPCSKSAEREVIVKCAKGMMEKEEPSLACQNCAEALRDTKGKRKKKKGAKR